MNERIKRILAADWSGGQWSVGVVLAAGTVVASRIQTADGSMCMLPVGGFVARSCRVQGSGHTLNPGQLFNAQMQVK